MLQCYVNGLFLTAARDGTGVTGTREPVPGLSMWKFRRLGGGKFTLQNAALGTFHKDDERNHRDDHGHNHYNKYC